MRPSKTKGLRCEQCGAKKGGQLHIPRGFANVAWCRKCQSFVYLVMGTVSSPEKVET
jgi:hypothetical protein